MPMECASAVPPTASTTTNASTIVRNVSFRRRLRCARGGVGTGGSVPNGPPVPGLTIIVSPLPEIRSRPVYASRRHVVASWDHGGSAFREGIHVDDVPAHLRLR